MIKYIFFDFDGVLAESVNVKTEAFRAMFLNYGEEFAQKVVDFHEANGGISRFEKFRIFYEEWLEIPIDDSRIQELANKFSEISLKGVIEAPEVNGSTNFLQNSSKYIKYIITGTPTIEIKKVLDGRNISQYFKEAYGSPEKKDFWVKKILSENNISSEECVFIGDALADYDAAIKNNVHFILRETKEGEKLFTDFKGPRIKDLTKLENVIQNLS